MPRKARLYSDTGFYHVMLRGIDRAALFHSDEDRIFFIKLLERYCCDGFKIHCYCLMDNHVHLIVQSDLLSEYMHRLAVSYATFFNSKYNRTGHLFQNRFRSEVLETEGSVLRCSRYILQNPVKAGLATSVFTYRWSSWQCYFNTICSFVESLFIESLFKSKIDFEQFVNEYQDDGFIDVKVNKISDHELYDLLMELLAGRLLKDLKKDEVRDIILQLKAAAVTNNCQMARVTGLGVKVIRNAKRANGDCPH